MADANRRLIDRTPDGLERWLVWDPEGDRFAIQHVQDVGEVIEANKIVATSGAPPGKDFRHVARIPVGVLMGWIAQHGVDPTMPGHEALLRRLLNDPEWRHLRTGGGRL